MAIFTNSEKYKFIKKHNYVKTLENTADDVTYKLEFFTAQTKCKPEHRLIGAVILRALFDIKNLSRGSIEGRKVRQWFLSNNVTLYSFVWCCQHLGLHESRIKDVRKFALNDKAEFFLKGRQS